MADILLVDDSKVMRMLIVRALRQAGYRGLTVEEAENGQDALNKVEKVQPKLILSDWNMPEMSGIDFLRNLRGKNHKTPFGFITSEASAEIKDEATQAGARFLITKPFTSEAVQDALTPIFGEA
jgi:two-component system chemotaxis response regulator CheY